MPNSSGDLEPKKPSGDLSPKAAEVWASFDALIRSSIAMIGNKEMAYSVILSRITRELRRVYGKNASDVLRAIAKDVLPNENEVAAQVVVPDANWKMGPKEASVWTIALAHIEAARDYLDDDRLTFTVVLSCVIAHLGPFAHAVLKGMIEMMAVASLYDIDDTPRLDS